MSLSPADVMALVAQLETDGGLLHEMVHGGSAATVETAGGTVPSMAKFFADKGALIAAGFTATSTSEVTIGTGAKSFAVPAGKLFAAGQLVLVVDAANAAHWMLGPVTSYADTTLTLDVTESEGAGTISSWTLALCGQRGPQGLKGDPGNNAYAVAVADGFEGTEAEWLVSLKGDIGDPGDNAYAVAVAGGFVGTEAEWLASLKGDIGDPGDNAYAVAVAGGFVGTEAEWLASLKGDKGDAGSSFTVDATGTLAGRDAYDAEAEGFAYLATDTSELYIRETATAGVWSAAIAFGKGDPGDPGINTWGSIGGALVDQADLQEALDGKADAATTAAALAAKADGAATDTALAAKADAAAVATALAGKQAVSSELDALAALTSSAFGRALLELANAAALRAAAQLVIGTDVQAYDADLAAIAALTTTAYGRSLLTSADAAGLRTLAGLIIGTNVQAYHANLAALAGLTLAANKLPYATAAGALALADLTAFARTLLDDADAATALATLGALAKDGSVAMTGALTLPADPTSALHAATKQYVDNLAAGLDVKPSCRLATTANDTLSGLAARDGVTPVAGDRVLVAFQTTTSQNGIYVVASGAWTRATDMDSWAEVPGSLVVVETGTLYADTGWICTADQGGTLGTTAIGWSRFFGTGLFQPTNANLTALAGLTLAADKMVYATGSGALALADLTAFARGLMGAADGVSFQKSIGVREVLTASRTYYVSVETGSNSNNGLTVGAPFATIAKALSVISSTLDLGGYTVTIQLADGTYTDSVGKIPQWVGGGQITFNGNSSTPSNVVVSNSSSVACFNMSVPGSIVVQNLKMTASSGRCLYAFGPGATITTGAGVVFGASAGAQHVSVGGNGLINLNASYTIDGGANQHIIAAYGNINIASGITVTLTGAPAFSVRFCQATLIGYLSAPGVTFSGAATGQRYYVAQNSVIFTNSGGASYFPGNSAGADDGKGMYV